MRHIHNLVTDEEIEDAETERKLKNMNDSPWDFMSDDGDDDDDGFPTINTKDSDIEEIFGGDSNSSFSNDPWGMNYASDNMNQTPQKSSEDKVFEGIKEGSKAFVGFLKEFVEATKQTDVVQAIKWGTTSIITSVIVAIIGLIIMIFGVKIGFPMMIGALLSLASGLVVFGISFEKQKKLTVVENRFQGNDDDELITDEEDEIDLDAGEVDEDEDEDDVKSLFSDDEESTNTLEPMIDDDEGDSLDIFDDEDNSSTRGNYRDFYDDDEEIEKGLDKDEKKERLASINISSDVVTRQYLMEAYTDVLPEVTPKYCKTIDYDEDDRDFKEYAGLIRKAALVASGKKSVEDMPKLEKLQEKSLYTKIVVSRSHSINVDKFINELTQLLSYNQETDQVDTMLYINYNVVGDKWILKVFTGETAKVSIMDTYNDKEVKEFIADKKNIMPVVLGINEEGKAIYMDLEKVNSLLITGMPRSGKSWFALAMLTQMTMYMKPSQLEIYMIDPKGETSDFRDFMPPHVKCFVSEHQDIITLLTKLIDVEATRRTKMFGEQPGVKNIQDWNRKNPLNPCSYIYVYIDEVVTLAEAMDKETKQIFQSKLMEITTRLPNLGIRPILVPHVVKDQILKKSITDNIPCRISVKGDTKHIEACVGVDEPPFTYRLTHVGDMAVMLLDRHIHFVHSVIISENADTNIEMFDYLRQLWEKLEPESIKTSYYYKLEHNIPMTTIGVEGITNREKGFKVDTKKKGIEVDIKKKEFKVDAKKKDFLVNVKKKSIEEELELDGIELSEFMEEEEEIDLDEEIDLEETEINKNEDDESIDVDEEDEEISLDDEDEELVLDDDDDIDSDADDFLADIFGGDD